MADVNQAIQGGETVNISPKGLALTRQSEGCKLSAYRDPAGLWTIGTGHLLSSDKGADYSGLTWTQEQADVALESDMRHAVDCVNGIVTVPLNQNQFDALCDFAYNVGCGAFRGSTALLLLNQGHYDQVPSHLEMWNKAGGMRLQGLVQRRAAEAALFLEAV